jgi:hypothetical protein
MAMATAAAAEVAGAGAGARAAVLASPGANTAPNAAAPNTAGATEDLNRNNISANPDSEMDLGLGETRWYRLNKKHWFNVGFSTAVVVALAFVTNTLQEDAVLVGASVMAWAVFFATAAALWAFICGCLWLFITCWAWLGVSPRRRIEMKAIYASIAYLIWAFFMNIAFEVVFRINPFPSRTAAGRERRLDRAETFWLRRILLVNVLLAMLMCASLPLPAPPPHLIPHPVVSCADRSMARTGHVCMWCGCSILRRHTLIRLRFGVC